MPLFSTQRHPLMCLTQDGLPWSHAEQARRLCAGGARWIQLRVKNSAPDQWLIIARETVSICREHGAVCIVNDNVDIAVAAEADGVHLGKLDLDWQEARKKLGPGRLLGGTINNESDVARALGANCLDYVGVGPWRFTHNKQNLAPVLGAHGVKNLIASLGVLPAWIIGGIGLTDLVAASETGAAGVAVSSALFQAESIEENVRNFIRSWPRLSDSFAPSSGLGANDSIGRVGATA